MLCGVPTQYFFQSLPSLLPLETGGDKVMIQCSMPNRENSDLNTLPTKYEAPSVCTRYGKPKWVKKSIRLLTITVAIIHLRVTACRYPADTSVIVRIYSYFFEVSGNRLTKSNWMLVKGLSTWGIISSGAGGIHSCLTFWQILQALTWLLTSFLMPGQ